MARTVACGTRVMPCWSRAAATAGMAGITCRRAAQNANNFVFDAQDRWNATCRSTDRPSGVHFQNSKGITIWPVAPGGPAVATMHDSLCHACGKTGLAAIATSVSPVSIRSSHHEWGRA